MRMAVFPDGLRFINGQCGGVRCIVVALTARLHQIFGIEAVFLCLVLIYRRWHGNAIRNVMMVEDDERC
jgi:hypothetical protein